MVDDDHEDHEVNKGVVDLTKFKQELLSKYHYLMTLDYEQQLLLWSSSLND